jgi:hypothetical protein
MFIIEIQDQPGDRVYQSDYSEFVISYARILAAAHNGGGILDDVALQRLLQNAPQAIKPALRMADTNHLPSKVWISNMIFRAVPPLSDGRIAVVDRVRILAGMASVLSSLGFRRKKAFIVRDLVATLIPNLIQARKIGAAELGAHPAAGLSGLGSTGSAGTGALSHGQGTRDSDSGIRDVLHILCEVYGIVGLGEYGVGSIQDHSQTHNDPEKRPDTGPLLSDDSNETVIARIARHAVLRSFGNQSLKLNVLRCCINMCEALPDLQGVLHFSSELLRTAGSGIAPEAGSHDGAPSLSHEEQVRLAANMSRTVLAARKLGLSNVVTDYWDEFLIRGVDLIELSPSQKAIPRRKESLNADEHQNKQPGKANLIFNPFMKTASAAKAEQLLIAEEHVEFMVTLQNLYDFEIEIEKLKLDTEGVEFMSMEHSTIVGPYRKQTMIVVGIPKAAGGLRITGCTVQVRGCRERRFPIFHDAWYPVHESRAKSLASSFSAQQHQRSASDFSGQLQQKHLAMGPKAAVMSLSVIERLPLLVVTKTSLKHGAMMMLEGESRNVSIFLKNVSSTTPVNLLFFTSEDSTQPTIQAAMRKKDTTPAEMHELELLYQEQSFKWNSEKYQRLRIDPGESSVVEMEVFGKPGLTGGVVQLDYTYLESPAEGVADKFYTRQLKLPLTITANPTIELVRTDYLPFSSELYWSEDSDNLQPQPNPDNGKGFVQEQAIQSMPDQFNRLLEHLRLQDTGTSYCLLLLDLRNSWLNPLAVSLRVHTRCPAQQSPGGERDLARDCRRSAQADSYTLSDVIQPGHTVRFMLPLPRILVQQPWAPIPIVDPANRRQFVLRANRPPPEAERQSREMFWYRSEVLKLVAGRWEEAGTGRHGSIDLRALKLSPQTLKTVKMNELDINMAITPSGPQAKRTVNQIGPSKYQILTDELFALTVRVHNRSHLPIRPILRLQPSLRDQPEGDLTEISRFFLWHGLMQQRLQTLAPGAATEISLGLCVLCRGEYQIRACVEEIRPSALTASRTKPDGIDDGISTDYARRIWHADESCVLLVMEGDSTDNIL